MGVLTRDKRLGLVLAINLSMVLGLVIVGLVAHSLGVLASGADYLGDGLGTGLSLVALRMSRHRHGHPRATSFAALANSTLLLAVTISVIAEAAHRLIHGAPSIEGLPVILASLTAGAAMIGCALILGDVRGDLSMQSVMLDTVADAAAAFGVAISGAVILLAHGLFWLDSAVALAIAAVIGYQAVKLISRVISDLQQKSAQRLD